MFSGVRLRQRREELQMSQAEMARALQISRTSYFNWENNKTQPNETNLNNLAEILKVEPLYFHRDYELIALYHQLHPTNQQKFMHYGQTLLNNQANDKPETVYEYHVYEKLSAGSGYGYLEERSYDVVYHDEEKEYDLASWVYGDSMEPNYPNGSVVLIRDTGFDYDGGVYAVEWDGQTYLKRVYREEEGLRLVSYNSKYQDKFAPYREEPRVIGQAIDYFVPKER